jgi:hypothetical protein
MVKVLLHLNTSVALRPNTSSASPGVVPVVRPGVRCPDHQRSELVGRRCRLGRLRRACSIRCRSAHWCRSAQWLCRQSPNRFLCQLWRANILGLLRGIHGRENVVVPKLISAQLVLGGRVETRLEHRRSGRGRNICRRKLKDRRSETS